MASDDSYPTKQQAKQDLLRDLESLREQLADPENSDFSDGDIPILLDKVEQAVASSPDSPEQIDDETAALQAAYDEVTQGLPEGERSVNQETSDNQQQSLFADKIQEQPKQAALPSRPIPRGDNPFLPKHIRDRLSERRQLLAEDIAQASAFFPSKASAPSSLPIDHQQLIDELIADYLPRIERELRRRLQYMLEQSSKDQDR